MREEGGVHPPTSHLRPQEHDLHSVLSLKRASSQALRNLPCCSAPGASFLLRVQLRIPVRKYGPACFLLAGTKCRILFLHQAGGPGLSGLEPRLVLRPPPRAPRGALPCLSAPSPATATGTQGFLGSLLAAPAGAGGRCTAQSPPRALLSHTSSHRAIRV